MKTESFSHSDPEDIFAKAIERVEAGEAIEAVLATAPEPMRAELRELLLLITATHHLQRAPVPQPAAPRRADRKKAFLEAAAQMKAEIALDTPPVVVPAVVTKPEPVKKLQAKPSFFAGLANFWRNFQASFASPNFSLAPIMTLITAVILSAFGFVSAAQAAELGDLTYPVKQWMDYQTLTLSPAEVRPEVYGGIKGRLIEDVTKAKVKLEAVAEASGSKQVIITTESLLVVDDIQGDYLVIGSMLVLMKYQPNPNVDEYVAMTMSGVPSIDSQVELTFQIISDANKTPDQPLVVQGRALTVITDGVTFDNSVETSTPCVPAQHSGWVPYTVQAGQALTDIAEQTGTTVSELMEVNCLVSVGGTIPNGRDMIFAPKLPPTHTPTPTEPPLSVTLTVYSEKTLIPAIEVTATLVPTGTVVMTPTVAISATSVMTPTGEITATATLTGTPDATTTITATIVQTPTLIQTVTPTVTLTLTGQATEDAELKGTLTATAPVTVTVDPPTGTPLAPTVTAISTPEAPATAMATPAETATGSEEQTPVPPATSIPEGTELPTVMVTPTPTANANGNGGGTAGGTAPTATVPPVSTVVDGQEERPTATPTPIPQNRSPLTGG